jgi:hypothetical protein
MAPAVERARSGAQRLGRPDGRSRSRSWSIQRAWPAPIPRPSDRPIGRYSGRIWRLFPLSTRRLPEAGLRCAGLTDPSSLSSVWPLSSLRSPRASLSVHFSLESAHPSSCSASSPSAAHPKYLVSLSRCDGARAVHEPSLMRSSCPPSSASERVSSYP